MSNGLDLDLMTPHEAADVLNVTTRTVRRWAREGRIPSVKLGDDMTGTVRIPREGLRNMIAARSRSTEFRVRAWS